MTTLNLGCGDDYRDGDVVNVDVSPDVNPDVVVDLSETPWPWPNDSFTRIVARHVLEHLDPVPWEEIERVSAQGATFDLTYPIGQTRFEDPTHRQYWNVNTALFLAGETEHIHETPIPLTLKDRDVSWDVSGTGTAERAYVRLHRALHGTGPWMEQVPGVYGEVTATYTVNKSGEQ